MAILEFIKVVIFGIIEGITEWLPISSTGHMILAEEFLKLNVSPEFWNMFLVVIQLGAICAVIVLYWKRIFPFSIRNISGNRNEPFIKKDIMIMWSKVAVAILPAIIIGLPFDDLINELFFNPLTVALTLIAYGILFIIVERQSRHKTFAINDISELTYRSALFIGMFQVLALIPGTSRSGATIIGAMLIGTSRVVAADFTFFLAIPVMFGASLLKIIKFGFSFSGNEVLILLTGMVTAFIVSIFAIKFLMAYIKKHDFTVFGYYRIILGLVVAVYFLLT